MSLFGSLMGGFDMGLDEDDLFGGHFRQMNNMMNSMFSQPFGGMFGGNMLMNGGEVGHRRQGGQMMPFGGMFGGMPNMSQLMSQMSNDPNCHSFSSSTVMTMTNGPDGRPQVYQASSSTRQGPGGIKETKKSVCDSHAGIKKMQIGHHIGEKAHIIEREQDMRSGQQEENEEFINLDEDEADSFNREWQQKTNRYSRGLQNAINYGSARHQRPRHSPQLALPSSTSTSSRNSHRRFHKPKSSISRNSCVELPVAKYSRDDRNEHNEHNEHNDHNGGVEITEITEEPEEKDELEIVEPSNISEPGELRRKRDFDHDDVPARKSKKMTKKNK